MPRYLVTGAAGFIGSNLSLELEAQGAQVLAVDSLRSGTPHNLRGFRGRVETRDVAQGLDFAGPWDAIFHHGDITDPRHPDDAETLESNVAGFTHALALARASGARLVYASTAGLYGNGPTPMREDQPKDLLTAYGRSKMRMEELAAAHVAAGGTPVVGLRYFNVFGPLEANKGRAASMVFHLFNQVKEGKPPRLFEWGEQKRDFIYVKDVVRANLCALTAPSGAYNVGTGVASTFNELVAALGVAFGKKLTPEYIPMPYDPASYQGNTLADTTLARTKLGFEAKWGFTDAVVDYVAWMRNQ